MGFLKSQNPLQNEYHFAITFQNFGLKTATHFYEKVYVLSTNNIGVINENFGTISSDQTKRYQEEISPGEQRTFNTISNLPGQGTSELKNILFAIHIEYKPEDSEQNYTKKFYYKFNMEQANSIMANNTFSVSETEKNKIEEFLKTRTNKE